MAFSSALALAKRVDAASFVKLFAKATGTPETGKRKHGTSALERDSEWEEDTEPSSEEEEVHMEPSSEEEEPSSEEEEPSSEEEEPSSEEEEPSSEEEEEEDTETSSDEEEEETKPSRRKRKRKGSSGGLEAKPNAVHASRGAHLLPSVIGRGSFGCVIAHAVDEKGTYEARVWGVGKLFENRLEADIEQRRHNATVAVADPDHRVTVRLLAATDVTGASLMPEFFRKCNMDFPPVIRQLVYEYGGMSLEAFITKETTPLPDLARLLPAFLQGMARFAQTHVHYDLSASNVLVAQTRLVVIDLARALPKHSREFVEQPLPGQVKCAHYPLEFLVEHAQETGRSLPTASFALDKYLRVLDALHFSGGNIDEVELAYKEQAAVPRSAWKDMRLETKVAQAKQYLEGPLNPLHSFESIDVFCLGMVLFKMLVLAPRNHRIAAGKPDRRWVISLIALVCGMTHMNPSGRMSMTDASRWFTK